MSTKAEQLRKRRSARLIGLGAVVLVLVALALVPGGDGGDSTAQRGGVACDADAPEPADPQRYDRPERVTRRGVDYRAVVHTSCGDIEMDLLERKAPATVNSFVFLAQEGFFDGLTWHRVERNFVIQTGDPEGDGTGGPGYTLPDEFPARAREYVYGVVAMTNAGPGTTGSQWFVVMHDPPRSEAEKEAARAGRYDAQPAGLQPFFTIFAVVDPGSYDTLEAIARQPTREGATDPAAASRPVQTIYIESIEIIER